jgi:hypothetical protein
MGSGIIKFSDETMVCGTNTKFTQELKVGDSIKILVNTDQVQVEE